MITKAKEILAAAKDKMSHAVTHLDEELKTYRAGKANPMVFNNVMVDYYGSPTPIPQVASITTPDAKTLMLQPWEKKMIAAIGLPKEKVCTYCFDGCKGCCSKCK